MKKIIAKILGYIMTKKGFHKYFGVKLIKEVLADLFNNQNNSLKEKMWAYKRGFLSTSIKEYGLNEENYKLFLSDYDYYKLYPINNKFRIWIDDKLTTRYILAPFSELLPEYYCHIKSKDDIVPLVDGQSINSVDGIINKLEEISNMALKPVAGSLGEGFYKLSYNHNKFYINGRPVQRNEIVDFLNGLENYIVTEYIIAHSRIRNVSDFGLNTLRVMVIKDDQNKPIIANAFMRFGTKATGVVDNASAGGIFTIVDVEKGKYSNPKRVENYRLIDCDAHPDTQENLEGYLPNWDYIKESLITVSKYLSEITYMGFDIAITDCGFKIIEINSHQDIKWYQYYYPLLINNEAEPFFKKLLSKK